MSVNNDWNGLEFISTIEHRHYPFYGVQFHPEKNLYEWVRNKNISHSSHAITASQYFAEFFVNEARKSDNHFEDTKTQDQFVIYNFPPQFTGAKGSSFEQSYLFPIDVKYFTEESKSFSNGIYCSFFTIAFGLSVLKFSW
jgi:gamma-glutamyl hydrolase